MIRLRAICDVLPMSYDIEALQQVGRRSNVTGIFLRNILALAGVTLVVLFGAAATLRRQTASS